MPHKEKAFRNTLKARVHEQHLRAILLIGAVSHTDVTEASLCSYECVEFPLWHYVDI